MTNTGRKIVPVIAILKRRRATINTTIATTSIATTSIADTVIPTADTRILMKAVASVAQ